MNLCVISSGPLGGYRGIFYMHRTDFSFRLGPRRPRSGEYARNMWLLLMYTSVIFVRWLRHLIVRDTDILIRSPIFLAVVLQNAGTTWMESLSSRQKLIGATISYSLSENGFSLEIGLSHTSLYPPPPRERCSSPFC